MSEHETVPAPYEVDYLPGQVHLKRIPLGGTMGRSEREAAAAVIVFVCQVHGAWKPVTVQEAMAVFKVFIERKKGLPFVWACMPMWKPSFDELVERGYARWTGTPVTGPVEFTMSGFEAMRLHVRETAEPAPTLD